MIIMLSDYICLIDTTQSSGRYIYFTCRKEKTVISLSFLRKIIEINDCG